MKKNWMPGTAIAALLVAAAPSLSLAQTIGNGNGNAAGAGSNVRAYTATPNNGQAAVNGNGVVNRNVNGNANGATNGSGNTAAVNLSDQDRNFLKIGSEDNITAIRLGQLAEQKATNKAVRQLAQNLVADHSQAEQALQKIAQGYGMVAPNHVKSSAVGNYDSLWTQSGRNFNTGYVQQVIANQQAFVGTFKNEAQNGENQALAKYAQQELPVLNRHVNKAQNLNQQLNNNNS